MMGQHVRRRYGSLQGHILVGIFTVPSIIDTDSETAVYADVSAVLSYSYLKSWRAPTLLSIGASQRGI